MEEDLSNRPVSQRHHASAPPAWRNDAPDCSEEISASRRSLQFIRAGGATGLGSPDP
jgi:hypothetical protein